MLYGKWRPFCPDLNVLRATAAFFEKFILVINLNIFLTFCKLQFLIISLKYKYLDIFQILRI